MQSNFFQGNIAPLDNFKDIQYLDVSHNKLSGQIPGTMVRLSGLLNLNLSFNNLEGAVPSKGVFTNASKFHVFGNLNLCGGIQDLNLQPCFVQPQSKHRKHISLKLIAAIDSVVLFLALLLFLLYSLV